MNNLLLFPTSYFLLGIVFSCAVLQTIRRDRFIVMVGEDL